MTKILKRRPGDPCCGCSEFDAWEASGWKVNSDGEDDEVVDEQVGVRSYVKVTGKASPWQTIRREAYAIDFRLLGQTTLTIYDEGEELGVDPGFDISIDNTAGTVTMGDQSGAFRPAQDPGVNANEFQVRVTPTHVHFVAVMTDGGGWTGWGTVITANRTTQPSGEFEFDGGKFFGLSVMDSSVTFEDDAVEGDDPIQECSFTKLYPCNYSMGLRLTADDEANADLWDPVTVHPVIEATGDNAIAWRATLEETLGSAEDITTWVPPFSGFWANSSGFWLRVLTVPNVAAYITSQYGVLDYPGECNQDWEAGDRFKELNMATGDGCSGFTTYTRAVLEISRFYAGPNDAWEPGDPTPLECEAFEIEVVQHWVDTMSYRYPDPEPDTPYPKPVFDVRMISIEGYSNIYNGTYNETIEVDVNDIEDGANITNGEYTWRE